MTDDNEHDPDYDLAGIDRDIAKYLPPARPSQRREARKLAPLIERILAAVPTMPTADVRRIVERNRHAGPLPDTATFNREFAKMCCERRGGGKAGQGAKKPTRPGGSGPTAAKRRHVAPVDAVAARERSTVTPISVAAGPASHPLAVFGGKFGGMVYKHGPTIRAFFSAVEKQCDDATLKSLAQSVARDAAAQARLADLHPKDRSIFEAALALA